MPFDYRPGVGRRPWREVGGVAIDERTPVGHLTSARLERRRVLLWPVVVLVLLGLSGLALLGVATARVGFVPVIVGALLALLPVGPVLAAFLWIDRWEPEPPKLLLAAFVWGACGATGCALLINNTAEVVGESLLGTGGGDVVAAVISAPLVEEAAKALFVVGVFLRRRVEFDGIVDGIVYSGVTAIGFAFTENINYFGLAFREGGFGDLTGGVVAVFVLRGILTPFAHPLFSAMVGIGVGIAAGSRKRWVRTTALLVGYALAVLLHAVWNGAATLGGGATFVDTYFVVMVPIFVATLVLVLWQRRREQRTVVAQLPGFAEEGWIAPGEVTLLSSLPSRKAWRKAVRERAGAEAARAVREYQHAVTELAFLRHRVAQGLPVPDAARRQAQAVGVLLGARAEAVRDGLVRSAATRVARAERRKGTNRPR